MMATIRKVIETSVIRGPRLLPDNTWNGPSGVGLAIVALRSVQA